MPALRRFAVFKSLGAAGAALAGAAGGRLLPTGPQSAHAAPPQRTRRHDLRPDDPAYHFDEYESITDREVQIRQVYQWPTLTNPIIYGNIRNGLNGFQFSYGIPADQIQVVVQAYASANGAMYDDYIWDTYRMGESLGVKDPATGQPATRNLWYASSVPETALGPNGALPADRTSAVYSDTSIQGLQRRGVLFLT